MTDCKRPLGPTRRRCLVQGLLMTLSAPVWAVDDAEDEPFVEGAPFAPIRKVAVLPLIMASQIREPELKEYVARAGGRAEAVVLRTDAAGQPQRSRKGVPLFQVSQGWVDQVIGRLQQVDLKAERYPDRKVALAARQLFDFHCLTTGADAILDLRVESAGYDSSMGVGWHPQLVVTASLFSMRTGNEIEGFTYWCDHREKPKDPRCFPAPSALVYDSLTTLQARVEEARAGMERMLARMTDKLVDDVRRCAAGQIPEV